MTAHPFIRLVPCQIYTPMLSTSKMIILLLLLVVGCVSPSVKQKEITPTTQLQPKPKPLDEASYPDWFWKTYHSKDSLFAVGFSETFFHPESSERNAIKDGIESLARSLSVHIKGERGILRGGGQVVFSGDDIQEELSPSVFSFVEKHHQVIAIYASPKYTFVLLCLGERNAKTSAAPSSAAAIPPKPSWITDLPKESGYLYALGHSNPYHREVNAWRTAEKHARIAIALSLESKVRGLAKKLNASMETISTISTDVQLNRVQVISRWKHPQNKTCHVLVRMPMSDNAEAIKNLLRAALSQKDGKQKLSREEIIKRAFDELNNEF